MPDSTRANTRLPMLQGLSPNGAAHGRERFIISVHLIKTLLAGEALMQALPEQTPLLAASLNRFLTAPMKGRHVLRTARQMWELVEEE